MLFRRPPQPWARFNVYMSVEVEPGSNTYRAKIGDIQWFLRFFYETTSGYECDQWTRSLSKSFRNKAGRRDFERLVELTAAGKTVFDPTEAGPLGPLGPDGEPD